MKTMPRPKRHLANSGRSAANGQVTADAPVQTVIPAAEPSSTASGTPPQTESQTQAANRIFRQRAEKIADVHVTVRPGENLYEPIYSVEVPDLWSEAFDKIVKLRSSLYRKYPDAIINLQFRPLRELAASSSVTQGMPSQAETQTQAAARLFLRRVEKIVGAQTARRANGEIYLLAYDVEVPDLWSEAADQVYTLRGDLYRKHPDAQIEIEVRGRLA